MKSVLIVDDHPVVRAAVKIVLEREGFKQIQEASNAGEGTSILRYDCINLMRSCR